MSEDTTNTEITEDEPALPPIADSSGRVLTAEELAIMDRAVRQARSKAWCEEFSTIAGRVFGVPDSDVVDSDGYNCKGFDRKGFNRSGRDRRGYDKNGFNRSGYNREGFDKNGFNEFGLNKDGLDSEGRDSYRFDAAGWDRDGYNSRGIRNSAGRAWYTEHAAKPDTDFVYDHYGLRSLTRA